MASAIINEPVATGNTALSVNPDAPTGPVLKMVGGIPMVSSREVADHFGKRHADLIRSIQAVTRNAPGSFNERNFALVEYVDPKGEKRPAYNLTRDGFVIVAMGFTGKKAIEWKIRYVMAFNAMEAELMGRQSPTGPTIPSADLTKLTTVDDRRPLKALVDAWVAAAKTNGKFLTHSEAFRIARSPVGGRKTKELTLADIPVAMAWVQEQLDRELKATPALEGSEPKSLPPARRRNNLDDYKNMYRELPDSPQPWLRLITETFNATEAFGNKLDVIKAEATKPFRSGRTSDVSSYFDASMSPMFDLFAVADEQLRLTYRCVYNALEGCRNTWLLLNKG